MKLIKEYGSTVAILIVGVIGVALLINPASHPLEGQQAPDFQLPDAAGKPITLAQHRGNDVVVLDFWASWCPPCREGLPIVAALAKEFEDAPVAVYAINIQESEAQVASFIQSTGLDLNVLRDENGQVATDYGVTGIPQTVIIGKDGQIATIYQGLGFNFQETLIADVQSLLNPDKPEE